MEDDVSKARRHYQEALATQRRIAEMHAIASAVVDDAWRNLLEVSSMEIRSPIIILDGTGENVDDVLRVIRAEAGSDG